MQEGVVAIKLSEAIVQRLNLQFHNPKTGETKDEGNTRPEVILRQLCTAPGQVYNVRQAKRDIDAVYSMGIFEDVNLLPTPVEDDSESSVQKV